MTRHYWIKDAEHGLVCRDCGERYNTSRPTDECPVSGNTKGENDGSV